MSPDQQYAQDSGENERGRTETSVASNSPREPASGSGPDQALSPAETANHSEAQAELQGQAARMREQAQLLDLANDAIFIRRLDGTVCFWNDGAERLYGWTRADALNQRLSDLLQTEYPIALPRIKEALFREGSWEGQLVHRCRDGSKVTVASRWTLWRDQNGIAQGWLQINTDITERKRAEEMLRQLSARLLQTQDEERRRIARELHDSAGQMLVGLDLNLMTIQREAGKLSENCAHALAESVALVKELSTELRTISHLLHPPLLDEAGLPAAIRWYVERFSARSKVSVQLEIAGDLGRMPRDIETTVFRIVQESLTNIHRHSGSAAAAIRLTREPNGITVEVRDEGKGMETQSYQTYSGVVTPGVGIQGMRERVRQLGGRFEIQSTENGTSVLAALPLEDGLNAKSAD